MIYTLLFHVCMLGSPSCLDVKSAHHFENATACVLAGFTQDGGALDHFWDFMRSWNQSQLPEHRLILSDKNVTVQFRCSEEAP